MLALQNSWVIQANLMGKRLLFSHQENGKEFSLWVTFLRWEALVSNQHSIVGAIFKQFGVLKLQNANFSWSHGMGAFHEMWLTTCRWSTTEHASLHSWFLAITRRMVALACTRPSSL
jgi:hypothetical protein